MALTSLTSLNSLTSPFAKVEYIIEGNIIEEVVNLGFGEEVYIFITYSLQLK